MWSIQQCIIQYVGVLLSIQVLYNGVVYDTTTIADAASPYIPSSLQSGPDLAGSSFAASVMYDSTTNSVVITGSTFGRYFATNGGEGTVATIPRSNSNCFLATVLLPMESDGSSVKIQWDTRQTLGDSDDVVNEACGVAMYHQQRKKLIVLGFSEPGGFLDDLYDSSSIDEVDHYGVLLDMNVQVDQVPPFHLIGGRTLQQSSVNYPIMATTSTSDDYIYVVSQETDNRQRQNVDGTWDDNNQFNDTASPDISSEVDPMRFFQFGDNYKMTIRRFKTFPVQSSSSLRTTIEPGWDEIFATNNNEAVHVSGIAVIGDVVIVVGCTAGTGSAFGGTDEVIANGTLSGFVTKLNRDNGTIIEPQQTSEKFSHRIQSVDGGRVWTAGMCNDPNDPKHIYIVGATEEKLDGISSISGVDAYVMKVDTITLEEIWIKQLSGASPESMVRAISCALSPDGNFIWVGGVVQADAVVVDSDTEESFGGDDVFVAKMSSVDSEVLFVRQIGSSEDDGLAMRGGLTIDQDGNCIVVGNTYGSMYRVREMREVEDEAWISDVFITTISGDNGAIAYPLGHSEFQPQPGSGSDGSDVLAPANGTTSPDRSSNGVGKGVMVIIVLAAVGVVALAMYARNKSKINRDVTTNRANVIQFLNDFDVEDIDLKHSATGGWHCSYSNDLANGLNRRAERGSSLGRLEPLERSRSTPGSDPLLTAPLNSSLIKDSLFMYDDENDNNNGGLGHGFSESRSSQRPGYDGLMDAYNSTWDDRRSSHQTSDTDVWGKEIL